jgi:hypothetical protein
LNQAVLNRAVFLAVLSRHRFFLFPAIFVIFQNPQIPSFSFLNHVFIIPKFPLSCDFQNVGLGMEHQSQNKKNTHRHKGCGWLAST